MGLNAIKAAIFGAVAFLSAAGTIYGFVHSWFKRRWLSIKPRTAWASWRWGCWWTLEWAKALCTLATTVAVIALVAFLILVLGEHE